MADSGDENVLGDSMEFDDIEEDDAEEGASNLELTPAQQKAIEDGFNKMSPNEEGEIPSSDVGPLCTSLLGNVWTSDMLDTVQQMTEGIESVDLYEAMAIVTRVMAKTTRWGRLSTAMSGHVGFEEIDAQVKRKMRKRGYTLNIMVVGDSGLGKSSLIDSLFHSKVSRTTLHPTEAGHIPEKTVEIKSISHVLDENGVRVKLTIIDTPGFGDQINNFDGLFPILNYIEQQYSIYLDSEIAVHRKAQIPDSRVHACIYFIAPTGHGLRPLDIDAMMALHEQVNLVPVIAKADSLTIKEKEAFKQRIREDIEEHGIKAYPLPSTDLEGDEDEDFNEELRALSPFAVVSCNSETTVGGKVVRGRQTRCGFVQVENPDHCDFSQLRDMLVRRNLVDLVDTTAQVHYEQYRCRNLEVEEGAADDTDV